MQHPAAKLLVLAAQAQQQEIGDATNFVSQDSCAPLRRSPPLRCCPWRDGARGTGPAAGALGADVTSRRVLNMT